MIREHTIKNETGIIMEYLISETENRESRTVLTVKFNSKGQTLFNKFRVGNLKERYKPLKNTYNSYLSEGNTGNRLLPFIRENLAEAYQQGYIVIQKMIVGSQTQYMVMNLESTRNYMYDEEQLKELIKNTNRHKRVINTIMDDAGNLKIIGRIVETNLKSIKFKQ